MRLMLHKKNQKKPISVHHILSQISADDANFEIVKVHLHWQKRIRKRFFLVFLLLLNVNIELYSLWTHLEAISLSRQYK